MKRVLVTGATGFVGSRVVGLLLRRGVMVGAFVRSGSACLRLDGVKDHPCLSLLEGDITSSESVTKALSDFAPDGVIHLAAAGVRGGATAAEMDAVNVTGLANLLERPDLLGGRIVVAGSVFEYGLSASDIDEEGACAPFGDYGRSKLAASRLLFERADVDWVLLRPFGVYGPAEGEGRLLPDLIAGFHAGHRVPLSDGGQVRDFTFVDDVAAAFVLAFDAEEASRCVINVASGRGVTVKEFARAAARCAAMLGVGRDREACEALLGFGAVERRPGEPQRLVAKVSRARRLLGWQATTSLEAGIESSFPSQIDSPAEGGPVDGEAALPELSIVVPCYNEEGSLPLSIPPLVDLLAAQGVLFELVLVNNGSADGTGDVIDRFVREGMPVVRVDVALNQGYGFGILRGLEAARGRLLGYMCADGQVSPADVARVMRAALLSGGEALVKARRVSRGDGLIRWIQSRCFNLLCLILFRTLTTDVNGTPKMMGRDAYERMNLRSRDWFIDAETVFRAKALGLSFVEVPVDFKPREAGRSRVNVGTILEFARNMLRCLLRFRDRVGK
jgi:nucleoside-diphosphate-sugar epimerase